MKKNILTKYLPFVAAVLLATSCSKDDNGNDSILAQPSSTEEVVQPEQTPEEPKTVTIPFSVKVDNGTSLSKISYTEKDGTKGRIVHREFDDTDCGVITLSITGTGVEANPSLALKKEGSDFVFYGDITVGSTYQESFNAGTMALTGTFTYDGKKDNDGKSTTSLVDLEENHCDHTYKAEFKSGDDKISLVDQNAYLCVTVATTQSKFDLTFNDEASARTFEPNSDHKIWIAVPCGGSNNLPTVKGTMISVGGKDLTPGTVYKVDRTKEVDLGPGFNVLWTTCNLGANNPGEYGNYYAYGETTGYAWGSGHNFSSISYKGTENPLSSEHDAATAVLGEGYRMPTSGDNSEQYALANCSKTRETQDGNAGYKFYTDYGSVFLPAAGYWYGTGRSNVGSDGYYWSSTPDGGYSARSLRFYSGLASVNSLDRARGLSVRPVRCMN